MTGRPREAGDAVPVRVQDLAHGAGTCVVVRRWPLATLVAYLFEGRECDDVRALLARGAGVARGSRLTWPPIDLSADELSAIERTFPPAAPGRPLDLRAATAVVLHASPSAAVGAVAGSGGPLALARDAAVLRSAAARASYVRFDYGPWADLYDAPLEAADAEALLAAARAPATMDADVELIVVRHGAGAARLELVVPRQDVRAPWRELPP